MATYKSYTGGTGGGPPKTLNTTPAEDDLLEFLTPEASGMPNIPEAGAIGDETFLQIRSAQSKPSCSQNLKESSFSWQQSSYLPTKSHTVTSKTSMENVFSQNLPNFTSTHLTDKENVHSDEIYDDIESVSTRVSNNYFCTMFICYKLQHKDIFVLFSGISQCT